MRRFQADVHRSREIEETLHHRVQPVDFLVQHLHGLPRRAVGLRGERFLQVFQPQPHRIQRVLYFVRHACGDAPQRRQPLAHLKLCIDAFQRVQVAQRYQRAHAFPILLDGLYAHAYTLRAFARL